MTKLYSLVIMESDRLILPLSGCVSHGKTLNVSKFGFLIYQRIVWRIKYIYMYQLPNIMFDT